MARGVLLKDARPDLAEQVVDKSLLDTLTLKSNKKIEWECPKGHRWEAAPNNRQRQASNTCPVCSGRRFIPEINSLAVTRPDLASQLADPDIAWTITAGSNKKVEWICPDNPKHRWVTQVAHRTRSDKPTGCPFCAKGSHRVVAGETDLATTHPEIAAMLADQSLAMQLKANSDKVVDWVCTKDPAHKWSQRVAEVIRNNEPCPYCGRRIVLPYNNDISVTHPEIAAMLLNPEDAHTVTSSSYKVLKWQCKDHPDHVWERAVARMINRKPDCPYCSHREIKIGFNNIGATHPEIAAELLNPEDALTLMAGSTRKVKWKCSKCGHIWITSPNGRCCASNPTKSRGCPACSNNVVVPFSNDISVTHPEVAAYAANPDDAHSVTHGSTKLIKWRCPEGHEWASTPMAETRKAERYKMYCPICEPYHRSYVQEEVECVIKALFDDDVDVLTDCRSVLPGRRELDIYLPDKKFAIEFNGVYFHSERIKNDNCYHQKKYQDCMLQGISLVQIWEDTWRSEPEAVIVMLAKELGVLDKINVLLYTFPDGITDIVDASRCTPSLISPSLARPFLEKNGYLNFSFGTYHFALTDENNIMRAVLSVRSPESMSRAKRAHGEWTLSRYAEFGIVPHGLEKLLHFAEKKINADEKYISCWYAFSSNDISDGSEYKDVGFVHIGDLAPDYQYVNSKGVRSPKENFQRKRFREDPDLLWNESWTEHEAALKNHLYRVYDSGKKRWIKNVE